MKTGRDFWNCKEFEFEREFGTGREFQRDLGRIERGFETPKGIWILRKIERGLKTGRDLKENLQERENIV